MAGTIPLPPAATIPGGDSARAWRALFIALVLSFCHGSPGAASGNPAAPDANEGAGFKILRPEPLGEVYGVSCPSGPEARTRQQSILGDGWWRIRATRDHSPADQPALVLETPFQSHFQVWLPNARTPLERTQTGRFSDSAYPARLAVFPIEQGLRADDHIDVCVQYRTSSEIRVQLIGKSHLQRQVLGEERRIAILNGTLAAMVLAGIGMAIAVRNVGFLLLASALFFALLYMLANSGWVFEMPGLARAAEVWSMQRIGGTGATFLIGLALARYISLAMRMPVVWRFMQALLLFVAMLFLITLIPVSIEWKIIAQLSNIALLMICFVLFGSGIYGSAQGHHPSRVLLLAWTPPVVLVTWLTVEVLFFSGWSPVLNWLFPLGVIYSSTTLFVGLADEITRYRSQRDRATLLADHDDLTGALRRRALDAALQAKCNEADRRGETVTILFLDVDNFKRVNDQSGHEAGDRSLCEIARRIRENLRLEDDLGRYGGEEFLVAMNGADAKQAIEIAERIRVSIENDGRPIAEGVPPLTVSIGIAVYHSGSDHMQRVIQDADEALRRCKRLGKNRIALA